MWPDGICRVTDTRYTKTIQYQDINYQLSQNEDKTAIFEAWCDFLNYFDSSVQFQLSFVNLSASQETFARSISIPPCGDEFDGIRAEYAGMLQNQLARGNNGLIKTKYLTFGVEADNLRAAKPRLERIETDLLNNFKRLGVVAAPLNGFERLHVMHDILRMDEQEPFRFSWDWLTPSGLSTKDFIAPSSFEFKTGRKFRMGKKLGAVSFVQILAPELNDRMLADFLDMESSVLVNLHVQSVDQVNAIKTVKRKITDLDKSKIEEQKKAVRAGYDMDIIPSDLATYGAEAKKLLQDLQSRNERMFLLTFLILNTADTPRQLDNNIFQTSSIAQKYNCGVGMKREPRLQFSDADLVEPKLEKPIKRVKKAEAKADKAQAKIPKKTVVKKERGFDPATGKVKTQLRFEEVDKKKPPSKLTHAVRDAPANLILSQVHREVRQSEDDNVGVEAAHKVEQAVESGGRLVQSAHRAHQLKPYRAAIRAEKKLERANLDALQKKAEIDSPTSNPVSKWQQKQAIKKQYAAAKHNQAAQTTAKAAENTAKAAKKAAEKAEKAGKYVWEHRRGFAIAAAILLMLAFLLNGLSSCSVIMDGVGSGIAASTYPSQDADMLGAEAQYCEMEAELQRYLDTYESTHDYDEYHFDLDTIEHDPYVLISMITALHQGEWTLDEVQGTLQMLFDRQYILTEDVVVETRYRTETDTWTDADGNTHTDTYQVPYDYYICTVTLENFNLSHVPVYIMSEEQLGMYATYMATLGNRPDLFPGSGYIGKYVEGSYTDYDIPPEALDDEVFAAIIKEAEKYLGYPYVWGGSSPSTSFDCSGFVSWVINHSGWDVGRLGAQGLCNICTPVSSANVKPGDLVFFTGTYDTPGVSHVGIYVGNNMMIHCGDPISYANLNSNYWQSHFYRYGRLP